MVNNMYSIGQTLYDKGTKQLVLYIGFSNHKLWKDTRIWVKFRNGEVIKTIESFDRFTHIKDKSGKPIVGKHSIPEYFGRLRYKQYKNMLPDDSIKPDNINFFIGE